MKGVWLFFRKQPLGVLGFVVVLAAVLVAVFADDLATHDPVLQDVAGRLRSPGQDAYFGTDGFGRDVFSRVLYGARVSLFLGLVSVAAALVLGAGLGFLSGYLGGKLDLIVQRLVDALLAFPPLVLALVAVAALGPALPMLTAAIALAFTLQITRLARAQTMAAKKEAYVVAARALGATGLRIMRRHVLPNSAAPVLIAATGYVGEAVIVEAALSYFGLGVPPPAPSWGRMIQDGVQRYLEVAPWVAGFPLAALSLIVLGFTVLGDALRDHLDPWLRGQ